MKILLLITSLLIFCPLAQADMKISVTITLNGPSITLRNATPDDIESGRYEQLLLKATQQANSVWRSGFKERRVKADCDDPNVPFWQKQHC